MAWEVCQLEPGGPRHVRPLDDLRPHGDIDCWCHPYDDGGIWVHSAMDRRELVERGKQRSQ